MFWLETIVGSWVPYTVGIGKSASMSPFPTKIFMINV